MLKGTLPELSWIWLDTRKIRCYLRFLLMVESFLRLACGDILRAERSRFHVVKFLLHGELWSENELAKTI